MQGLFKGDMALCALVLFTWMLPLQLVGGVELGSTTPVFVDVDVDATGPPPQKVAIEKRVYSDELRLIFFAGLEGTGHHLFAEGLRDLKRQRLVARDEVLSGAIFSHGKQSVSLARLDSPEAFGEAITTIRERLACISTGDCSGSYPLIAINCITGGEATGQMSYPNYGGPQKPLQYVDLIRLSKMAEEEGVDFRVIYMHRPARDIIRSTTENRHFGTQLEEGAILYQQAHVLNSMFGMMDSNFIHCFDYGVPNFSAIGNFLYAGNKEYAQKFADVFDKLYIPQKSTVGKVDESTDDSPFTDPLEQILSRLWDTHCKK